jgi:hypothetical protein
MSLLLYPFFNETCVAGCPVSVNELLGLAPALQGCSYECVTIELLKEAAFGRFDRAR